MFARWKGLDEIYQMAIPLHLWNPVKKPRKALLQSVTRAKSTAPERDRQNCSDAAGPGRRRWKMCKVHPARFVRVRTAQTQLMKPLWPQKFSKCPAVTKFCYFLAICAETLLMLDHEEEVRKKRDQVLCRKSEVQLIYKMLPEAGSVKRCEEHSENVLQWLDLR